MKYSIKKVLTKLDELTLEKVEDLISEAQKDFDERISCGKCADNICMELILFLLIKRGFIKRKGL